MNTKKYYSHNVDLLKENDRSLYQKKNENGEKEEFFDSQSRSKIDFNRTKFNYNCCPHPQYSKQQLIEIHEEIRGKKFPKNGVLFGSTVITLPKDYDGDKEEFFRTAYEGLKELYKLEDQDIVSAFVHMDETSPHMHFNFIPVHRKNGKETISWEKTMPKAMYDCQHRQLENWMNEQEIGAVHLLNGESLGYDVQNLTAQQKELFMQIHKEKENRELIYDEINNIENKRYKLQKDMTFFASKGDEGRVEKCEIEFNSCNIQLQNLAKKKKEIGKKLDELYAELNENEKISAYQREIIDLTADRLKLEESYCETVLKMEAEKQNHDLFLANLEQEINQIFKGFKENDVENYIEDLKNSIEESVRIGRNINEIYDNDELTAIQKTNKAVAKMMEKANPIINLLQQQNRQFKEKWIEAIEKINGHIERERILANMNIPVFVGRDGLVTEKSKDYLKQQIINNLYNKDDDAEWDRIRGYYWQIEDDDLRQEFIAQMVKANVANIEELHVNDRINFLEEKEIQKMIRSTPQYANIGNGLLSTYMQMQQQIVNEYER